MLQFAFKLLRSFEHNLRYSYCWNLFDYLNIIYATVRVHISSQIVLQFVFHFQLSFEHNLCCSSCSDLIDHLNTTYATFLNATANLWCSIASIRWIYRCVACVYKFKFHVRALASAFLHKYIVRIVYIYCYLTNRIDVGFFFVLKVFITILAAFAVYKYFCCKTCIKDDGKD